MFVYRNNPWKLTSNKILFILEEIGLIMRINKQTISKKMGLGLAVCGICMVVGVVFLMTQKIHTQTVVDEKRQNEIAKKVKEQRQMFWKVSSVKNPSDDGNRIVAVRRIKLRFEGI